MMQTLRYRVRFTTPAFLGNAEQSGQWRTPPFKALLRQWWRVVYAANSRFAVNVGAMRREEGRLFGNAWLQNDFRKSAVRIRLSRWDRGTLNSWNGLELEPVIHPEVTRTRHRVGPHAYLGYGPLDGRRGTRFAERVNAAIQADETAELSIAVPDAAAAEVRSALALVDAYGSAGGRCRNGWGSLCLDPDEGTPAHDADLAACTRPWPQALDLDWPHCIGRDDAANGDSPLVWRTAHACDDWRTLMRDLAIVKIGLRTMFVFPGVPPPHLRPMERHWLSYPITRHGTRQWSRNARLPNTLRFKVRPDKESHGRLRGVIYHAPCRPPPDFRPDVRTIRGVWRKVHALLDELCSPVGARTYATIGDRTRRGILRPQLDRVALERIAA